MFTVSTRGMASPGRHLGVHLPSPSLFQFLVENASFSVWKGCVSRKGPADSEAPTGQGARCPHRRGSRSMGRGSPGHGAGGSCAPGPSLCPQRAHRVCSHSGPLGPPENLRMKELGSSELHLVWSAGRSSKTPPRPGGLCCPSGRGPGGDVPIRACHVLQKKRLGEVLTPRVCESGLTARSE